MINYFNFGQFNDDHLLLTNDYGCYSFITKQELGQMLAGTLTQDTELYDELHRNGFILENAAEIEDAHYRLRGAKQYLFESTSLHIFVLTNDCNLNCRYCQARDHEKKVYGKLSVETAKRAVDIALNSPNRHLNFEFQGGEPLLNFDVLRFIVEYANEHRNRHEITFSVVTNLTLLTDEMLHFFRENDVRISTSLDGPEYVHNNNRPYHGGTGSYEKVIQRIGQIKSAALPLGAIQTTTRYSLDYPEQIVDEYARQGFTQIFIRPLTRLGTAYTQWDEVGYTAEEFVSFYRRCLMHILKLNRNGVKITEGIAGIFLAKIINGKGINYMELRSPCGAGLGQMAYYIDGNVYTCDEGRMLAEMGNAAFRLGNVYENSYDQLTAAPECRAACMSSTLESIPGCCDCVYQPYCGVCPVVNYACEKNVFKRTANDYRCRINKGILKTIFELLYENDPDTVDILKSWA